MSDAICRPCGHRQPLPKEGKRNCSKCGGELVPENAPGGDRPPPSLSGRGRIVIEVTDGSAAGQVVAFESHNTLLCGREPDCHVHLTGDDAMSRHHFLLELDPPRARLRDLGSRNGTFVNDARTGRRELNETPGQAAKRKFPEIDLHDGDKIKVGRTTLRVKIEQPPPESHSTLYVELLAPTSCSQCGRAMTPTPGKKPEKTPICSSCAAGSDPMKLLVEMVGRAGGASKSETNFSLPGFQVERRLGQGACGAVYLARRRKSGERIAIKVMLAQVAVEEGSRGQFQREIEVLRQLDHPNIVKFHEHGSAGDAFYFAMDYCEGGSVFAAMKQAGGKLPFETATAYALDALEGMAYAHGKGFIHRDLKPLNILLSGPQGGPNRPVARVSDFGLAKSFENAGLSGMTMTGSAAGSPDYMPREQVTDYRDVKPASDVFSMGASYYHMLTGLPPRGKLEGQDPIVAVLQVPVIPIQDVDPKVPKAVAAVIARALKPKAQDRYPSATEFRDALKKAL